MNEGEERCSGPPPWALAWNELPRAIADYFALGSMAIPLLWTAPRGDRRPVFVLPGFAAGDGETLPLRAMLAWLGYDVHHWGPGRNWGYPQGSTRQKQLIARIARVARSSGRKVTLVGWSLGGNLALQIAGARPDLIAQVISLGSPLRGNPEHTRYWRMYSALTGDTREDCASLAVPDVPLVEVPFASIFSRSDGIVPWQNSIAERSFEAQCGHFGLIFNPAALLTLARLLAVAEAA